MSPASRKVRADVLRRRNTVTWTRAWIGRTKNRRLKVIMVQLELRRVEQAGAPLNSFSRVDLLERWSLIS